jgi:anaerobic selenocysteine-containing dehydrogenase
MHPDDGRALELKDGDWVTVESATGQVTARIWLTDRVRHGELFLPEHFGCLSDLQGGSAAQKEPEGLAHLVTGTGPLAPVRVRASRRRDMRRTGI